MALDLPTFATDFEPLLELVRRNFENVLQWFYWYDCRTRSDCRLYTIVWSIIGFTRDHGMFERLNRFLFLFLLPFLSSLLSRLGADAASSSRDCLFIARTLGLSAICRNDLIIGFKCLSNAMFFSILSVFRARCFLRIARLLDSSLPRDFFTLAHISHVRLWRSINNDWLCYRKLVKSFSISPVFKRTMSITKNLYFSYQQSWNNK